MSALPRRRTPSASDRSPPSPLVTVVSCTDDVLIVQLPDGCVLTVPYLWIPRLASASPADRANCSVLADGRLYWPALDEIFDVAALLTAGCTASIRMWKSTPGSVDSVWRNVGEM